MGIPEKRRAASKRPLSLVGVADGVGVRASPDVVGSGFCFVGQLPHRLSKPVIGFVIGQVVERVVSAVETGCHYLEDARESRVDGGCRLLRKSFHLNSPFGLAPGCFEHPGGRLSAYASVRRRAGRSVISAGAGLRARCLAFLPPARGALTRNQDTRAEVHLLRREPLRFELEVEGFRNVVPFAEVPNGIRIGVAINDGSVGRLAHDGVAPRGMTWSSVARLVGKCSRSLPEFAVITSARSGVPRRCT